MAQNATEEDKLKYQASANGLENGQVTVWPFGTSLMDFAGSSRGVDPFTNFITHQEKTILMLATGGTLGSMAEAGTGTLAGNAQQDVWESIVARDSLVIAQAMMRDMLRPYLESIFPGKPIAVDFGFDLTHDPTPKEIFEIAAAAKTAGYLIDREQLEEKTGFKLEKAPEMAQTDPAFAMNKATPSKTPLQTHENRLQNVAKNLDEQGEESAENALREALNGLFEKTLAETMAEELEKEVKGEGEGEEIKNDEPLNLTQEEAERIYEEMMGNA